MADKGFEIKVLLPTDDGITISIKGIENAKYYLMYNLSNRSYQLAGKIKLADIFLDKEFDYTKFEDICLQNNIDKILTEINSLEINEILNNTIDQIDLKKTS